MQAAAIGSQVDLVPTASPGTVVPMRLLVRKISRETKEEDLRELFEAFGAVQSCVIVMDDKTGRSKGFGFVEMPKPGDAKAAIYQLNGQMVDGEAIRVKKATSP